MSKRTSPAFVRRILSRLSAAEAQEPNPWLRDDLCIARLTLAHAARGDAVKCSPHVLASYEVLGLHPEKVWPAIQKRREALGPLEAIGAPPKKPAQSAKLWLEKTSGARAVNSRADETLLRDNTISVPMAAPSIAAAYRNSDAHESEKSSSPFARVDQVRASTLTARHRDLIVAMLHKNRFGDELWMSTESIRVVMGRVCNRRKTTGWSAHQKPRQLHNCEYIHRRTVQRLIDEVVSLGILTQVYGDNERVPYGGGKKFRHTATYRLNPDKLVPRKTHDEYVEERDRGRAKSRQAHREQSERDHHEAQPEPTPIRKPAAPAPPLPPAPAAPQPARSKPAAEHRGNERPQQPKLTRRESAKFIADMAVLMKGCEGSVQTRGGGTIFVSPTSNPEYYRPKMSWRDALSEVCKAWKRVPDSVIDALKFWGYHTEGDA
jgi:hypothetical protein